ncbi:putative bifunctional diguanylate cyclase/phosphodiesterase [Caulobacter sp. KR2-114]|uniref:putative bifunctional diguanylate cyclase/phosphodiesterase n=1 Tax=Caulobacter sp. KR2-114 TaxID=3400912 RepID=UPI003C08F9D2
MRLPKFRHLRTRLAVLYAALFGVALTLISLAVYGAVTSNAERVTRQQLAASGAVFDRLWSMRSQQLEDGAGLLSRDFGFRAAVATHDKATIQSALENLRRRLGIDEAFIVGVDGTVMASDDRPLGDAAAAVSGAAQNEDAPAGVLVMNGRPFQAIAAPILSPTLTGWVVFAGRLDDREMTSLERLSAIPLDAMVLGRDGRGGWVSSNAGFKAAQMRTIDRFIAASRAGKGEPGDLPSAEGPAIALAKPLKAMGGGAPAVLLLRYPLARALAPYQALTGVILVTGLMGLALVFAGSWALARSVTRPISALEDAARRLQAGQDASVTVDTRDEIARLADSFNAMAAEIGERERRITHLAMHDGETELANRLGLEKHLTELRRRGADGVMVAAVGVERYGHLRAAIGYEQAGALVRELGARLARRMPSAVIARLSSDVLGLAFRATDDAAATALFAGLVDGLEAPVRLAAATVDVGVTVGLAGQPAEAPQGLSAVERANIAVEQARAARRKIAVFDPAAYGDPASNLSMMSEMLEGLKAGQLVLHHQPKRDIRSGRICGVEALVRWRHPTRGLIAPDRFIPLAEETGHIRALTDWVLAEAIEHQAAMRIARHELEMSVNISGRLLSDPDFGDTALQLASRAEGALCFEVTETAVIENPELALGLIERFSGAGLHISIDDYGSGLSSLAYLKQIKANELKIDKAFVLNVADSQRDALLVRSTVDLAHSLGLKVTAEGVETETAYAILAAMGCDVAQGYLIARPMPLKEVLTFLHEDRRVNSATSVGWSTPLASSGGG